MMILMFFFYISIDKAFVDVKKIMFANYAGRKNPSGRKKVPHLCDLIVKFFNRTNLLYFQWQMV